MSPFRGPLGLLLGGYAATIAGIALLSVPAALIAGGVALMAIAIHEVYGK